MRYLCALFLLACGEEGYYAPQEQEFDDLGSWGDGIPGFEIATSGPADTGGGGGGGGGGNVTGIYVGTYNVVINRDNYGDTCSGSAALTLAVSEGCTVDYEQISPTAEQDCLAQGGTWGNFINIGSGSQIQLDCGELTNLRVRGVFDPSGLIMGRVYEEGTFGVQSAWTGIYSGGVVTGEFSEYLSSNQGNITLSGNINVTHN